VLAAAKVHANLSHTTPANPHLLVGGGSLVVLDEAELLLQSAECGQRRRRSKLHFHPALRGQLTREIKFRGVTLDIISIITSGVWILIIKLITEAVTNS